MKTILTIGGPYPGDHPEIILMCLLVHVWWCMCSCMDGCQGIPTGAIPHILFVCVCKVILRQAISLVCNLSWWARLACLWATGICRFLLPYHWALLAHQVTAGLGAFSPSEARQGGPVKENQIHRQAADLGTAPVAWDPREDRAACLLYMCRGPRSSQCLLFGCWPRCIYCWILPKLQRRAPYLWNCCLKLEQEDLYQTLSQKHYFSRSKSNKIYTHKRTFKNNLFAGPCQLQHSREQALYHAWATEYNWP